MLAATTCMQQSPITVFVVIITFFQFLQTRMCRSCNNGFSLSQTHKHSFSLLLEQQDFRLNLLHQLFCVAPRPSKYESLNPRMIERKSPNTHAHAHVGENVQLDVSLSWHRFHFSFFMIPSCFVYV